MSDTGGGPGRPLGVTGQRPDDESFGDLLSHLSSDMSDLVSSEMELARVARPDRTAGAR